MRPALFCLILIAASAAAEPAPDEELKAVEQKIEDTRKTGADLDRQAQALADELAKLQDAAVASARIAQENEARLTDLEARIALLSDQETRQQAALLTRQDHERRVMAGLQRLARNPPAAVLLSPGPPLDLARGAMLLGAAVPRLEAEAREIAEALGQLRRTRAEIAAQRAEISGHQMALDAERQRLGQILRQKQALESDTRERAQAAQQSLAQLTAQAGSLKELIVQVERERERKLEEDRRRAADAKAKADRDAADRAAREAEAKRLAEAGARDKPSPVPGIAGAAPIPAVLHTPPPPGRKLRELEPGKTALQMPAAGEISKRFGDAEGFSTAKGLTITTRVGAQVVAPFDGQIMFAGPFKGYGQILIIDHGGGYHSLLAGMDQLDASVGQAVIAGEPLGTMRTDGTPNLYLELRRQGQPINPLPWLAARDGKVSG
jgi:septal ring factor EnvC (AmiA/AmiB activator)